MKYKDFYKELLTEARYERYLPVLTGSDTWTEYDVKHVSNAVKELKRDDAIQWYLRWSRYLMWKKEESEHINLGRKYSDKKTKWLREFESKTKHLAKEENPYGSSIRATLDLANLSHYMSMPIDKIQNFRFGYQDPREVDKIFRDYETEWKNNQKKESQWIDMTEEFKNKDVEILHKFSDGFAWLNLDRKYCSKEGEAMGHCGNRASYKATDTVLSLRKLQKRGDRIFGRPSLTFILEKRDGVLGEMKGRANEKPDDKYHSYILKLFELRQENGSYIVQRILGGGYAPESNFDLSDLSEGDLKGLYIQRPDLKPLTQIHQEEGVSENLKSAIMKKLPEIDRSKVEIVSDGKYGKVNVIAWKNWEDLWSDLPTSEEPKNLKGYKPYIEGDQCFDADTSYANNDRGAFETLFDKIKKDKRYNAHDMKEYIEAKYDRKKIREYEEDSSIFDLLYESEDELISQLREAFRIGMTTGTESEMYESFFDGITNMEFTADSDVKYPFDFIIVYQNSSSPYNSPIIQKWDITDFIKAIDSGVEHFPNILNNFNMSISGDMDIPYYGFDRYDEQAAIDYFFDNLDI